MKNLTFLINGVDFSHAFNQYGYRAGVEPVYSNEIETMDRVRRSNIVRWRGWCSAPLNDLTDAEAAALARALRADTLEITYQNNALSAQSVTQEMTIDALELAYLLRDVSGRYWSGKKITFTQR